MAFTDSFAWSDLTSAHIPNFIWIITGLGFLVYIYSSIWSWFRLRHIPGPAFASISSFWLCKTQLSGNAFVELKNVNDKYGALVRIGPNAVIVSDVKTAQRLEAPKSTYTRGQWHRTFRFTKGGDHAFSLTDEVKHTALRKKIAPGYAGSDLMEQSVHRQLVRLVQVIESRFLSTNQVYNPVEFASLMHFFSMDVVGDMAFGKAFGFLDEGKDIFGYLKWNSDFFTAVLLGATLPYIASISQTWPVSELLPKTTDPVGLGRFMALGNKIVKERFKTGAEPQRDVMGLFVQHGVTEEEAFQELGLQVTAGTDSVATSLRMTLLYILANQRVYTRLLSELDTAITAGTISSPIRDAEAKRLPYLQAVVREGLRIFPGATPSLFKTVPKGGDTVVGYELPEGTQLGINIHAMLRSKDSWGDDADLFRPERWLEVDDERFAQMSDHLEVLFGYGRYKCLGRPLVFMQMNKVLPELLRRFDFTVVNPVTPLKIVNAGFFMMSGFWMVVTKRV